jgi:hypothetical protein
MSRGQDHVVSATLEGGYSAHSGSSYRVLDQLGRSNFALDCPLDRKLGKRPRTLDLCSDSSANKHHIRPL